MLPNIKKYKYLHKFSFNTKFVLNNGIIELVTIPNKNPIEINRNNNVLLFTLKGDFLIDNIKIPNKIAPQINNIEPKIFSLLVNKSLLSIIVNPIINIIVDNNPNSKIINLFIFYVN